MRQPSVIVLKHLDTRGLRRLRASSESPPAKGRRKEAKLDPVLHADEDGLPIVRTIAPPRDVPRRSWPVFALGAFSGMLVVLLSGLPFPQTPEAPAAGTATLPEIVIVGAPLDVEPARAAPTTAPAKPAAADATSTHHHR
jgi:hypothetical protein